MSIEAMTIVGKTVVGVAIALTVAVAAYKTKEPICLWGLLFVWFLW